MEKWAGVRVTAVDPDPDYLGIEVHVSSRRYSGTAFVYSVGDLERLASGICGFPSSASDARWVELGTKEEHIAGGYCSLRFSCIDGAGHIFLAVSIKEDRGHSDIHTSAEFGFNIEGAARIDEFVKALQSVIKERSGEAILDGIPEGFIDYVTTISEEGDLTNG